MINLDAGVVQGTIDTLTAGWTIDRHQQLLRHLTEQHPDIALSLVNREPRLSNIGAETSQKMSEVREGGVKRERDLDGEESTGVGLNKRSREASTADERECRSIPSLLSRCQ